MTRSGSDGRGWTEGPFGALRYNLEEMASFDVAVALGRDRSAASMLADAALAAEPSSLPDQHMGYLAGSLDAVRDCVA